MGFFPQKFRKPERVRCVILAELWSVIMEGNLRLPWLLWPHTVWGTENNFFRRRVGETSVFVPQKEAILVLFVLQLISHAELHYKYFCQHLKPWSNGSWRPLQLILRELQNSAFSFSPVFLMGLSLFIIHVFAIWASKERKW